MCRKTILQINISEAIAVLLLSVAFETKINTTPFPWYFGYLISSLLLPFLLAEYCSDKYREVKRMTFCVALYALVPYLIGLIYTFWLTLIRDIGGVNPTVRAMSEVGQTLYRLVFATLIFTKFREKTIDVMSEAMVLSYLYTLIMAFLNIGISGLTQYLSTVALYETEMNAWFERHDIGVSIEMLLICQLFLREKKRPILIMMMIIVMYLCHKRIGLGAFAVMLILMVWVRKKSNRVKNVVIHIISISVSAICMVYVWLIASGLLYTLAGWIGIDLSGRKNLFDSVKDLYQWSVAFQGKGLGFTGKYLTSIVNTSYAYKLGSGRYNLVHNDILKTYIDLGFIGSMLWFVWQNWKVPRMIAHRFGQDAAVIYCLMTVYTYITYMVDNTSTYFIFQLVLYSVVMYGCYQSSQRDVSVINFLEKYANIKSARHIRIYEAK